MTLRDAWRFVFGSVKIKVTGDRVEWFVNACTNQGINLWRVSGCEEGVTCHIGVKEFLSLPGIARASRCRIKIMRKEGLFFSLLRLRRRPGFVLGALVSAVALYLLSSVIWIIAVVGAERTSVDCVLAEAGEAGIKVGSPRAGVDPEAAATRILSSVDGLAWVGVRSRGGMVIIEIVEKKTRIPDFLTDVPCDIIAGCNGVIVKLVPLQGNAVAAQGATVRAGQVLISGAVPELAQGPDKDQGNNHDTPEPDKVSYPGFVRAQGIALATVWYEAYAEVPLRSIVKVNTGKTEKSLVLGYNGRYVVIYGKRQPSFSDYGEDERVLWRFSWRNRTGTVELKTITFNEVLSRPTTLSLEQATLQAKEEALKKVFERIPPGAEQVRTWASVVQEGPDAAGIKVTVETVEDIGVPKPLFQEPTVRAN